MPDKVVRLGFIGAGGYGRRHVEGFQEFRDLAEIVAVADPSPAVRGEVRALLAPGVRYFSDYRDLLASGLADAVVISAPIAFHQEMTLAAIDRGLAILLEKPPVPLLSQLEELIAADREGRVMVAFQKLYSDLTAEAERVLGGSGFGRLQAVSAQGLWPRPDSYYHRTGWAGRLSWQGRPTLDGPCTNGFAHFIHLGFHLAGAAGGDVGIAEVAGALYRARPDLESYDTGFLAGSCEDGAQFFMGFSHAGATPQPVELRLRGTLGEMVFSDDCCRLRWAGREIKSQTDDSRLLRKNFLHFAGGDAARNRTPLSAMRAYVLATNLMVQSAGGIHSFDRAFVRGVTMDEFGTVFEVEGLPAVLRHCASDLTLPSRLAAAWARPSHAVRREAFSEEELGDRLGVRTEEFRS